MTAFYGSGARAGAGTPRAPLRTSRALIATLILLLASCAGAPPAVQPPGVPQDPAGLDAWLSAREGAVPGLIPGDESRIEWAGAAGAQTRYAVVYLHGLQGSPQDYASVVRGVAQKLGANLYYQRLKGHSVTTDEIALASPGDWLSDAKEALQIGSRIGRQVIVAGSSMGGDLALWLAAREQPEPAALVLFSCAIEPREGRAQMLLWPWPLPQIIVGAAIGRYWHGSFDAAAYPTGNAALWNRLYPRRYRSESFITFMQLVAVVRALPLERIPAPSLWMYSSADHAVDIPAMRKAFQRIGGEPKRIVEVMGAHAHMLAGDIFSPETTDPVTEDITSFLAECGILRP